jgi:hypothetical protein
MTLPLTKAISIDKWLKETREIRDKAVESIRDLEDQLQKYPMLVNSIVAQINDQIQIFDRALDIEQVIISQMK